MAIARIAPLSDFVSLRDAMDQLFQESFIRPNGWSGPAGQITVPVDLWETKDAYHLRADLPGMTADDIAINVTGDTIALSGETKPGQDVTNDGWLRQERRAGKFQRAFTLPVQIDSNAVTATFTNGVLDLVLPKSEAVKPKTVKITAGTAT
ncbi:MAG TPA: Hsp20/alpha crystallin family protein [Candidatus Limnocylindria bacterium]|nr:Hsp20/alpha crystallin family protein [Candidatus Limnocylindria bacterium]